MKTLLKIISILLIVFGIIVTLGGIGVTIDKPSDMGLNIAMILIFGVAPVLGGVLMLRKQKSKIQTKKLEIDNVANNAASTEIPKQMQSDKDISKKAPIIGEEEKLNVLQDSMGTGEVIKIKYYGGTQPGTVREIVPLRFDDDKISALCCATDTIKSFFIYKMAIVSNDEKVTYNKPKNKTKYRIGCGCLALIIIVLGFVIYIVLSPSETEENTVVPKNDTTISKENDKKATLKIENGRWLIDSTNINE